MVNVLYIIIENDKLLFEFGENYGSLIRFIDKSTKINMAALENLDTSLWIIELVDVNNKISIDNIGKHIESSLKSDDTSQSLSLIWKSISINQDNLTDTYAIINVNINIILENDASLSTWQLNIDIVDGKPIGLWSMRLTIP